MIGVSKREDIFKNKGYFQKFLAPYNDARAQCQCGRSNILEERLQYFSHTQRVLDTNLCLS